MRGAIILRAVARQAGDSKFRSTHGGKLQWVKGAPPKRPKVGLWILALVTVGMVTGTSTYYISLTRAEPSSVRTHNIPDDVSDRYNETARDFDSEVGLQEMLMGINWIRRWLIRRAKGDVLEVSCGTARNSPYYDTAKCRTITLLDQSPEMIEIAKMKFKRAHPFYDKSRFVTQSALNPILAPPQGYDTIVQTMGVCSTPDPVRLLRNLASILNPDGGRILLIEHGRGHYDWINRVLDNAAPGHANAHGCWWNKEIGSIVADSGLEIVEQKRYHFGTTWKFVLKKKGAT